MIDIGNWQFHVFNIAGQPIIYYLYILYNVDDNGHQHFTCGSEFVDVLAGLMDWLISLITSSSARVNHN